MQIYKEFKCVRFLAKDFYIYVYPIYDLYFITMNEKKKAFAFLVYEDFSIPIINF